MKRQYYSVKAVQWLGGSWRAAEMAAPSGGFQKLYTLGVGLSSAPTLDQLAAWLKSQGYAEIRRAPTIENEMAVIFEKSEPDTPQEHFAAWQAEQGEAQTQETAAGDSDQPAPPPMLISF